MHATLNVTADLRSDIATMVPLLASDEPLTLLAASPKVQDVVVPPAVAKFIKDVLDAVHTNGSVRVHSTPEVVTTSVAADLLGVSRPTLIKWLNAHLLPDDPDHLSSHMVGTHTRLRSANVTAYSERRAAKQRAAFEDLRAIGEEIERQG